MSVFALIGVVTGLALTGFSVVVRIAKRQDPDLLDAVELLLASIAGGGGVKVFTLAVGGHGLEGLDAEARTFMVIGSICVVWVAVFTVVRVFRRLFAPGIEQAPDSPDDSASAS